MRPDPVERIDPRAVTVWMVSGAFYTVPFFFGVVVAVTLAAMAEIPWFVAVAAVLLFLVSAITVIWVVPKIRWMRWRYEVLDDEIYLKFGLIVQSRLLIPMAKVQHVDSKAGPLLRALGLSSVTVVTAGDSHEIPALSNEVADKLRDRIAARAGTIEDVV